MNRLFGKPLSPEEQIRLWRQKLRHEQREIERQIRGIEKQELQVKNSMKESAKRGDKTSCKMLAKEIIHARRSKQRLYTSKTQMNSVILQLQQQVAQIKVMGGLKKSADIMHIVNSLVKVPQISQAMFQLSQEMMKAGVIEEMIEDNETALLNVDDGDAEEIEEEADKEVDKIVTEITAGLLSNTGEVGTGVPRPQRLQEQELQEDDMEARLESLKS